ncbi:MAG TPA: IS21 family transposase, partial [Candidatus Saccharimonadales bacterium]|nr:IS21 family transposase [Candidatus Saccharimonadales bacterium]
RSAQVSQSTVHEYLKRFAASGLSWPLPAELAEADLEAALIPPEVKAPAPAGPRRLPDFVHIHQELQQHQHTTLQLLREEYRAIGQCL